MLAPVTLLALRGRGGRELLRRAPRAWQTRARSLRQDQRLRNGCVYTEIVADCKKATLQAIIRGRVAPKAVIHTDGWRGYDGLVDVGYAKHYRVNHGANEFARGSSHINGIESFRSFAKRRLQQFNGVPSRTFYLHLKECEWRFNNHSKNLYRELLTLLRNYPL